MMHPVKLKMNLLVSLVIYSSLVGFLDAHLFAPLTVDAFPSSSNTGVTAQDCPNWNERKSNTSGRTISTDGAVIDYEHISGGGGLRIEAKNVTIRCVKIDAKFSDRYGINCFTGKGCAGLLVENVEIANCTSACATAAGASGSPSIWRQVHLHDSQKDLLKIEGNTILEDSYLHGYKPVAGAHNDAIQTSRGSNIIVRDNRIEGPSRNQTSAYLVKTDFGPISNLRIENNLLSGGTFTLYLYNGGHGVPTKVVVRDNVWVKNSYKYGSYSVQTKASSCFEWSNNRFDDNSSLSGPSSVSPNGSCGGGSGGEGGSSKEPKQASAPSISSNGGQVSGLVQVVIETPEQDATIHYTLNGSTPTERSQVYTKPFDLSSSATVKAVTVKDGMDSSAVREAKIRISDRDAKPEEHQVSNDTDNALYDHDSIGDKVTEDEQNDVNEQDEQDYSNEQDDDNDSNEVSFFENFEDYSSGQDPTAWRDTEAQNSMRADQKLFETAQVDGTRCLGTTSPGVNIHTHYQDDKARHWTNYSFSGRMYFSDKRGGLGVTFFSQYIEHQDRYYRLRRYDGNGQRDFHLAPHGTSISGDTHSGVEPQANTWYRFHIVASDTGSQTVVKAKVWKDGTAEPSKFQIEATDTSSTRLRSGTIGLWSMRYGTKCFDQLTVR